MKNFHGKVKGFYDLNICASVLSGTTLQDSLDRAAMLGYNTVAVNVCTTLSAKSKKGKSDLRDGQGKQSSSPLDVPDPSTLPFTAPVCKGTGVRMKVLSRLTVKLEENTVVNLLNKAEVKKYDLLAVVPMSPSMFANACSSMSVDIISIDYETFSRGHLPTNQYKLAVRRGVVFELTYADLLVATSARRNVFSQAHLLATMHSARGILVSSGAKHRHQLRGPYDVPSLALLLSLPEKLAKASISSLAESVVIRSYGRIRLGGRGIEAIGQSTSPCDETEKPSGGANHASSGRGGETKRLKVG